MALAPQNAELSEGFKQSTFKRQSEGGVWLFVANFLVSESFVLTAVPEGRRSGHYVPVSLQQDKCSSRFCNFSSLYEWENVIPLKVRALRMGYPVCFRL